MTAYSDVGGPDDCGAHNQNIARLREQERQNMLTRIAELELALQDVLARVETREVWNMLPDVRLIVSRVL